jgi:hypothetical protein
MQVPHQEADVFRRLLATRGTLAGILTDGSNSLSLGYVAGKKVIYTTINNYEGRKILRQRGYTSGDYRGTEGRRWHGSC